MSLEVHRDVIAEFINLDVSSFSFCVGAVTRGLNTQSS